jgi:hypothetical protein
VPRIDPALEKRTVSENGIRNSGGIALVIDEEAVRASATVTAVHDFETNF